jgi:hypothetical protein
MGTVTESGRYDCVVTASNNSGTLNSNTMAVTYSAYGDFLAALAPTYWWKLTNAVGTTSITSATGTNNGSTSEVTFGSSDGVNGRSTGLFNMSGSIVYTAAPMAPTTAMSVTAVVCPTTTTSSTVRVIYAQRVNGNYSDTLGRGQMSFHLNANGTLTLGYGNGPSWTNVTSSTVLQGGTCYRVAGTRDSSGYSYISVNGIREARGAQNTFATQSGHIAGFGNDRRDGGVQTRGRLGDVSLWNRVLTESEIYGLARSGVDQSTTPPAAPAATFGSNSKSGSVVTLNWSVPAGNVVDGYRVYRKDPSTQNWYLLNTVNDLTTTNTPSPSGQYCYKVAAYNAGGEGVQSSEWCVTA